MSIQSAPITSAMLRRAIPILLAVGLTAGTLPAFGQTCDRFGCGRIDCATPARPAPSSLGGFLEAVDPSPLPGNRDATAFDEFKQPYSSFNWFKSLDIENGYLIAGIAHGIQVWDVRNTPASPVLLGQARNNVWPVWAADPHAYWPLHDVDAPANVDTVAAIVGLSGTGIAIFDLSDKAAPRLAYQSYGKNATQVYAATIGGVHYAFMASFSGPLLGGGLHVYNMDKAVQLSGKCSEDAPLDGNCGGQTQGIYLGKLGSRQNVHYVDGLDNFVVLSSGTVRGFEIWDYSNPASPQQKLSALGDASVYGVAMWKQGGTYYLGLVTDRFVPGVGVIYELKIYDVSCITGTCGALGDPLSTTNVGPGSEEQLVNFTRSGSKPFLYVTKNDNCSSGTPQREFLFDVSDPVHPSEVGGAAYWNWYYRGSPTGFNYVGPKVGKFYNDYFYRAAHSIMDVHKLVGGAPPGADFAWSPEEIYPGTPVNFTDLSTGAPTIWSWSFSNGTPASSTAKNPQGVTFAAGPGNAQYNADVTLAATNSVGTTSVPHTLTIQSPNPQVTSLTAVPSQAPRCTPIALTANGAKGQPPLLFTWSDQNGAPLSGLAGSTAAGATTWQTTDMPAGTYTVKVTVTSQANPVLPPAPATAQVILDPLPQMPAGGTFTPTNDAFSAGTVKFHLPGTGATEVSWKFGDEQPGAPDIWATDFNPIHTYTATGQKTITAKIRQCGDAASERPSAPLTINITQIAPLVAGFQAQGCAFNLCLFAVNEVISFTDSSSGNPDFWDYSWDGDDTYEDANHTSPVLTHAYSAQGTFKPKLKVRRGAEEKEFVHAQLFIGAPGGGGTPSIAVGGPTTGQVGQSLTYTAAATNCTPNPSGWSWSTSGGTGSSTTSSISITWSTAGGKSVTATNSGCAGASGSRSVTISSSGGGDTLTAAFTYSPAAPAMNQSVAFDASLSTGSPTVYAWTFGDGGEASGKNVSHTFTAGGSYPVKLSISKPGTSCPFGLCTSEITRTVVVSGGPPAPNAEFSADASCFSQVCQTGTGVLVTLTAVAEGAASYVWDFGDGTGGSGRVATHSWNTPGSFTVKLTVGDGQTTASKTRLFVVDGEPVATKRSVVLPWIAQTRSPLLQSSDLYIHNPGTETMNVTLEFRKRGVPESNPPQVTKTIQPGATLYAADVLKELFNKENVAGFIALTVDEGAAPVITSFNTTFNTDGKEFGQTVGGVPMTGGTSTAEDKFQNLVGLISNSERLAYFGVSNPGDEPATYKLRFFDKTGRQIGSDSQDFIVSRFGQRQFQSQEISNDFGVSNAADYRVEIETKSGGHLVPYASNLRLASKDPSFILAGASRAAQVYLIGSLSTPGLNNSLWQTDALLSNPSAEPITADVTFTSVGLNSTTTSPLRVTLTPGQTERLENVIAGKWGIKNAIGLLTISTITGGAFPIVQGESYDNTDPAKRFGQTMMAVSDANAAGAGQGQYLVGLRQDAGNRTTFWLFNNGTSTAEYDVIYRRLDGTPLGTPVNVRLGAGKLRQFSPGQHPLPAEGVADGFTVQINVKSGKVLSAAQVINNLTNDPAYIQGEVR